MEPSIAGLWRPFDGNTGWLSGLSVSHNRADNVLQAPGQIDTAVAEFRKAEAIMTELMKLDHDNAGWQKALVITQGRIGSVLLEARDGVMRRIRDNPTSAGDVGLFLHSYPFHFD